MIFDARPYQIASKRSHLRGIDIGAMVAGSRLHIDIRLSLPDMYLYMPLNYVEVTNNSTEPLKLYLDGANPDEAKIISPGTHRHLEGWYFERLIVDNIGVNAIAAGDVRIEVAKI